MHYLFMACQIGELKFDQIVRSIWPWIGVMVVVLLVITYSKHFLGIAKTVGDTGIIA